jgi:hypothetical protein
MEKRNVYRLLESQKERDHWEDQDVGEWAILSLCGPESY